jgi:hypothetical protein
MMKLDVRRTIDVLNSGDADAIERYLLELNPDAFARGRVYTTELALYKLLEERLATSSVDELLDVYERLEDPVWKRNVLLLAMVVLLIDDKTAEAEGLIARLDEVWVYQGYRVLLRHYAGEGDLENYRRVLQRSDRRRKRSELIRIERDFVAAYSRKEGLEAALAIVDQSKPWLIQEALVAQIEELPYEEIHRWAARALADEEMEYLEMHLAALEKELEDGDIDAGMITSLLEYIDGIEPEKRIKGSSYTVRQQALWRVGNKLLDAGLIDDAERVIKRMSNTKSKRKLKEGTGLAT